MIRKITGRGLEKFVRTFLIAWVFWGGCFFLLLTSLPPILSTCHGATSSQAIPARGRLRRPHRLAIPWGKRIHKENMVMTPSLAGSLGGPRFASANQYFRSSGASRGCLHGGASFKVERLILLQETRVRRTTKMK